MHASSDDRSLNVGKHSVTLLLLNGIDSTSLLYVGPARLYFNVGSNLFSAAR